MIKRITKTASDSSTESKMPETDEEWHNAMIEKSMVTYGNATAMQEKIKKHRQEKKSLLPI